MRGRRSAARPWSRRYMSPANASRAAGRRWARWRPSHPRRFAACYRLDGFIWPTKEDTVRATGPRSTWAALFALVLLGVPTPAEALELSSGIGLGGILTGKKVSVILA